MVFEPWECPNSRMQHLIAATWCLGHWVAKYREHITRGYTKRGPVDLVDTEKTSKSTNDPKTFVKCAKLAGLT